MSEGVNKHLSNCDTQMTEKYVFKKSPPWVIKDIQIKAITGYYLTCFRMASIVMLKAHYWSGFRDKNPLPFKLYSCCRK